MKQSRNANLKRLDRLVRIRQTYSAVAETDLKQADSEVRRLEAADDETVGNIQDTRAEIAYLQSTSGHDLQRTENYIRALTRQRQIIHRSLETATSNLDRRRDEWTEAMREEKIAEKLQERRLHQWQRENDITQQKSQDEASIARYVRARAEE
jgi:flagellar export protein FliJ